MGRTSLGKNNSWNKQNLGQMNDTIRQTMSNLEVDAPTKKVDSQIQTQMHTSHVLIHGLVLAAEQDWVTLMSQPY